MSRSSPKSLQIDQYKAYEILAEARSGVRELGKVRESLAGARAYAPHVRILFALARRGLVDLNALARASHAPGGR